jgi:hypothetical protein
VFKVCFWPNPVIAKIVHRAPEALGDSLIRPAGTLSKGVSERTVRNWLTRIDKDAKEARNRRIFDLWMACHTQQEIAEAEGIDQGDLSKMATGFMEIGNLAKNHKASAEHATDFEPPIYNIWKQREHRQAPAAVWGEHHAAADGHRERNIRNVRGVRGRAVLAGL